MSFVDDEGRDALSRLQSRQHLAFELGLQQRSGATYSNFRSPRSSLAKRRAISMRSSDELMNVASMPLSWSSRT
jgi:hypothetical protein